MKAIIWQHPKSKYYYIRNEKGEFLRFDPDLKCKFISNLFGVWSTESQETAINFLLTYEHLL